MKPEKIADLRRLLVGIGAPVEGKRIRRPEIGRRIHTAAIDGVRLISVQVGAGGSSRHHRLPRRPICNNAVVAERGDGAAAA